MRKGDVDCLGDLLRDEKSDMIHIHTFMEQYSEFFETAKQ